MTGPAAHSPYIGLHPFEEKDSALFFGRDAASHALLAEWLESRLVILHGPAGTGKTSLLRAGVLPNLASTDADVLPVARVSPTSSQYGSSQYGDWYQYGGEDQVCRTGNPYVESFIRSCSANFGGSSLLDAVRDHPIRRRPHSTSRPILVAVDQFEDFFAPDSQHLDPLRDQFVELLGEASAALGNLHILIVVRRNFRAALAPYEDTLAAGSAVTRVALTRLDRSSAVAAISEPLRTTDRCFAPGVAQALVDDLCTSRVVDAAGRESVLVADSVQPSHLQLVTTALWRSLPKEATTITAAHLAAAGDVSEILGSYLTQVIIDVADRHDLDDSEVRAWLTRAFVTERGRRGTVDEGISTTARMPNALLDAMAERYVLTSEWRSGSRRFELIDDRLVQSLQEAFPDWAVAGRSAAEAGAADYLQAALVNVADGNVLLAQAHVDEALRRGTDRSRTRAEAESLRAQLDETQDRPEDAEQRYREAAELYESLPDPEAAGRALASIGRLLLRRGLFGRAVEDLQAAASRLPGDLDVQADLARALWYSGQPWAATAIFSTVLTIAPESANALAGRGLLRLELGDDTSALDDLEGSSRLAPEIGSRPEVRAARALALARLGRLAEASTETMAALDGAPDSGPVLLQAAGVARATGDGTGANDMLRRSLKAKDPALLPHQEAQALRLLG